MKVSGFLFALLLLCPTAFSQSESAVSLPVEISFYGNQHFCSNELVDDFVRHAGDHVMKYDENAYRYFTQKYTRALMFSRGFWRAKIVEITPTMHGDRQAVQILVEEGPRYRLGTIQIAGSKAIDKKEILEMLGQQPGDIADSKAIQDVVYEKLKDKYGELGYVQYNAELEPEFVEPKDETSDGLVNVLLTIDEGRPFTVRRIKIDGIVPEEAAELVAAFPMKPGDLYVPRKLEKWADAINKTQRFEWFDDGRDAQILLDEEASDVDLVISLKKVKP